MAHHKTTASSSEVRTESFVIDLFLENDKVQLTKILHVQSDTGDRWDGWSEEKLIRFLKSQTNGHGSNGLESLKRKAPESTPDVKRNEHPAANGTHLPVTVVAPTAPPTASPIPRPAAYSIVRADVHKQDLSAALGSAPSRLTTVEPFVVELLLAPDKAASGQSYWATASARRFEDGAKIPLGAVRGTLEGPSTSAVINVLPDARLKPGLYSVWASVESGSVHTSAGAGMLELIAPPPS